MRRQNKQTDRYTAVKQIGKGSFGQVYKGIDKINKNQVALKFIEKRGKSYKDIQSLKQQNKLLKNINHQNIINFIDFLQNQKQIIIVTDYAGSDLARVLQLKKKFSLDKVKIYSKQILKAMLYLNENRIIHRDLKPQNILIQEDHIKICDFGFAKKLSASTNFLKSIKGTPLYLAPQIVLQKAYTQKVDIWSFGCIIYELFSGYPPFYANDYRRLAPKILHQAVKYPNDMPSQLKSLISNMLDKHDRTRYNWGQVKNHQFFKQPQPLSQIGQNIPILNLQQKMQKKLSQRQKNQIKEEVFYQQSRVLQKLDDKIELQDFINIEKQIKTNSKQLRQDPCFEYKLNFVFRQKCRENSSISNQIVQKILDILITLAKQKKCQCTDDIIKKETLIIGLLSVARLEQNFKMLQKQLKTLCLLIKKNFDGIQINPTINQEITQFITIILQKDNLPVQCLINGLMIIGTLTNQAILTFNRSQDYLQRILQDKVLTKICNFYKKRQDFATVLYCIQTFIHPTIKLSQDFLQRLTPILSKMKMQVAEALLKTQFLSQISPFQIYKQNNGQNLKFYITILLECLQISSQMRKKYAVYAYWSQLQNHQVTKPFAFVFNYLITQKEGLPAIITNERFRQLIKSSQDNKLINVYILHSGHRNITKSSKIPFEQKRAGYVGKLLQNIYDALTINIQQKKKSVRQVYGDLGTVPKHFDQLLIKAFAQIVETFSKYNNKQNLNQPIKITKKIFQLIFNPTNRFELTIHCLKNLMNVYAKQSQIIKSSPKNVNDSELFFYKSIQDCLRQQQFANLQENEEADFVSTTAMCLNFLNQNSQKSSQQHVMNIALLTYRSNFYKRFFSQNLSQTDFYAQLKCIVRIASKSTQMKQVKQNIYSFLGREVIVKCAGHLATKNQEFLIQICSLFSVLSRESTQFNIYLKQSRVVQYFQSWLTSTDSSQQLKDKVLYLIGNMAKISDYFFEDFAKYGAARAISKCIQKNPENLKNIKNTIYAVGNISFYNDRFSKQFEPLIPYFARVLKGQGSLRNNLISTISNLLRFTDVYLKSLQKTGLISQIVKIFCNCQASDYNLIGLCLSVIKKLLPYKQALSDQELQRVYGRKNIVKNQQMDVMNKIFNRLLTKGLIS